MSHKPLRSRCDTPAHLIFRLNRLRKNIEGKTYKVCRPRSSLLTVNCIIIKIHAHSGVEFHGDSE